MKYLIYISFILCFWSCQEESHIIKEEPTSVIGDFSVSEESISAGENITIEGSLETRVSNPAQLMLIIDHALFSKAYQVKLNGKNFSIEIPKEDNQLAGEVLCHLIYGNQLIQEKKYFVNPLNAIDKIQSFNGPKDLFAGESDASMNVSIPHDKFSNPMLPPSTVKYQSIYADQIQLTKELPIENLITHQITNTKTKTGKYILAASSKQGYSQEQELIIGAGMPEKFTIELLEFHPFADARQYIHFKTSMLKDKYENVVADGTMINFTIYDEYQLVGNYQAFTIGGIATVYIENPSKEVMWFIQASLHDNILSNKVQLNFAKNVNDFEVNYIPENNSIVIGPVIGILGQFVPDGTEVKISAVDKGLEDFQYLEDGKYTYHLPFDWIQKQTKQIEVLIGGHSKTIKLD